MTFTAEQPLPLEGTAWRLDGISTGTHAVSSTLAGTEVTASFDDGTLSGNGGCNTYNTTYTVDGEQLTIDGGIMSTKMACEPVQSQVEQQYLAHLANAKGFTFLAGQLAITSDEKGTPGLLVFAK